ncbi:MAG: hypothetical protein ACTS5F_02220 [Candidatus Hodgkinia cicadicola]
MTLNSEKFNGSYFDLERRKYDLLICFRELLLKLNETRKARWKF